MLWISCLWKKFFHFYSLVPFFVLLRQKLTIYFIFPESSYVLDKLGFKHVIFSFTLPSIRITDIPTTTILHSHSQFGFLWTKEIQYPSWKQLQIKIYSLTPIASALQPNTSFFLVHWTLFCCKRINTQCPWEWWCKSNCLETQPKYQGRWCNSV